MLLTAFQHSLFRFTFYCITCIITCSIYTALLTAIFGINEFSVSVYIFLMLTHGGLPIVISCLALSIADGTHTKATTLYTKENLKTWAMLLMVLSMASLLSFVINYL